MNYSLYTQKTAEDIIYIAKYQYICSENVKQHKDYGNSN